jgi:hypothetical protein
LALPSMVITVTLHAFVDESRRKSTYLVAAVLVDPKDLPRLRKLLYGLLFPGQRESHFKKETPERRRLIVSRLSEAGIGVRASTAGAARMATTPLGRTARPSWRSTW